MLDATMAVDAQFTTSTHTFFPAVIRDDVEAAKAMIEGNVMVADWERKRLDRRSFTPSEFFERMKPCYYRMGFAKNEDPGTEVGVWMCALMPTSLDPNLSRTIMVQATYKGDRVSLEAYNEQESMKPAPARGQ